MRKLMPLLLIAGDYVAYRFIKIKKAISRLQTTLSGISFGKTGLSNTALKLSIRVTNPSAVNLSFRRFFGQIFLKGMALANFNISNALFKS